MHCQEIMVTEVAAAEEGTEVEGGTESAEGRAEETEVGGQTTEGGGGGTVEAYQFLLIEKIDRGDFRSVGPDLVFVPASRSDSGGRDGSPSRPPS